MVPVSLNQISEFVPVLVGEIPALLVEERVARDSFPTGEYEIFDLRESDDDPGEPAVVEKSIVTVNWCGSLITLAGNSFDFGDADYINIFDQINYAHYFAEYGHAEQFGSLFRYVPESDIFEYVKK